MNRRDFIKEVADEACMRFEDIDNVLRAIEVVLVKAFKTGKSIKMFSGFVLTSYLVSDYQYLNLQTGKKETAKPFYRVKLLTSRTFKNRINDRHD